MRIMRRAVGATALVAGALILMSGALRASDAPVVHVKAVVKNGNVTLEAQANGPFEYTTYRPSESLFVLDLTGVSSADPAGARVVASDLVKSYRMLTYTAGAKPVVRVEILLSQGVEPRLERRDSQELMLSVSRNDQGAPKAAVTGPAPSMQPAMQPTIQPIAAKSSESKSSEVKTSGSTTEAIRQVKLEQNGELTDVNVIGTGKLNYHAMKLQNPDRLVLDFAGAHLRTSEKQIASNLEPVREIRLAQFSPEVSRIVIDLRHASPYNITTSDSGITVEFANKSAKSAAGGAVKSTPEAQPADVTTTELVQPSAPTVVAKTRPVAVAAPVIILPSALTQPNSALATPSSQPQPPQEQQVSLAAKQVAAEGAASASNSNPAVDAPAAASTQPVASVQPVAASSGASAPIQTAAPAGKYSGEPISVNLKDVDLRDFFRLIHEISGLNIVVDPSVKGSLTIVLDDVPWDQALDIVLKNNGLDKQLEGNVLRIATKDTLKREADQNRELSKAQAEAADVVTTTRVLSYAKAEDMVATLKKFLSSRGDVLADVRSNTLIIRDIPSVLPVLDNLLRQLDKKSQQVEIEARVVEATRSFSRDIGTQFAAAVSAGGGQSILGGASTVGTSPIVRNSPLPLPPIIVGNGGSNITSGSMPLITNLGAATPTSALSYAFSSSNFALDFIISAAEEKGVGKLISKPKVITQNNQKALVKQGTKIPVQTIVNNTVSVQFVDAVLQLEVTPQITADGTIYMDVTVTNDQIDGSIPRVQGIPAIDTQEATTKVLISDGGTVVIGGIIVSTQRTTVDQVPLFGSIPVVGNLFKHTSVSSTSQELLFFLTPRILPS
jgi:type IV pilus assembly protein PilQ